MMRLIVATDSKLGMATQDGIPWTLPTDQKYFADQLTDGLILMGFHTYDEIAEPLQGRVNYVATRRQVELRDGFVAVPDAVAFAQTHATEVVQNIGGAGLFAGTLHVADELLITRIDADFHCTKFFPDFADSFELTSESAPQRENDLDFTFQTWHPRRES